MTPDVRKTLLRALIAISAVLALGTVGYLLLDEGWSPFEAFYMTLITVTTIGYGEVRPLGTAGRVFTSILIVLGIGTAATALTQISSLLVESRIGNLLGRRKIDEKLKRLSGHYVVCGFGDLGAAICAELDRTRVPFVVVDGDAESLEKAETLGFPVLAGDATNDAVLVSAGIRRAAGLVICSGDMTTNLVMSMAARELNPSIHIIARGADAAHEERLVRAGADSVAYPLKLGGQRIARLIIEQSGRTPDDAPGSEEPGVLGYRVKLYRRYGSETERKPVNVGEIVARTGAVEAVSLKRADGSEIERPASEVPVGKGDALALLVREGKPATSADFPLPAWTEELSVGIASIDEEHRMLLVLIARIADASGKKTPRAEIAAVFDRLIEYTEQHFRHEEALLNEHGYPEAAEHAAEHRDLTAQVLDLNRDRRSLLSENVSDFLLDWLKGHIMESDKRYVSWLRERGVR